MFIDVTTEPMPPANTEFEMITRDDGSVLTTYTDPDVSGKSSTALNSCIFLTLILAVFDKLHRPFLLIIDLIPFFMFLCSSHCFQSGRRYYMDWETSMWKYLTAEMEERFTQVQRCLISL